VYGMLKTKDAVSTSIDVTQVIISLVCFTLLYGSLGVVDIYLLTKYSKLGPTDQLAK
jgi:cytochrome d ubiquinol oxidase subunit I